MRNLFRAEGQRGRSVTRGERPHDFTSRLNCLFYKPLSLQPGRYGTLFLKQSKFINMEFPPPIVSFPPNSYNKLAQLCCLFLAA